MLPSCLRHMVSRTGCVNTYLPNGSNLLDKLFGFKEIGPFDATKHM